MLALFPVLLVCCKEQKNQPVKEREIIVYIGTYTESEPHLQGKSKGIYIYSFNSDSGKLTYKNVSPATVNPSYLAISPDKKYLYAVNETGTGMISAFRLTAGGDSLHFINKVSSEGDSPCFIETDKDGRYVFTANYGSGNIALFPVNDDGSLQPANQVEQHKGRGLTDRQESPHAHCIRLWHNDRFVYSCDLGTDKVYVYTLDKTNGKLLPGTDYSTMAGAGPRHMAFHPLKNIAYVINELNGTIECLKTDTVSGELVHFQTVSTSGDSAGVSAGCADIHITPDGEFLYASNRGTLNSIAMYTIDRENGTLAFTGLMPVKGKTPRNFAIDPTGNWLLVANQNSDQIVSFRIDHKTGRLVDTGIIADVPSPVCIQFLQP